MPFVLCLLVVGTLQMSLLVVVMLAVVTTQGATIAMEALKVAGMGNLVLKDFC